jgi:hypothetical protein
MARPAVDYPDPAEHATPNMAGADDLLAQLAGDEVDRLLAEAEDGSTAAADPAATADAVGDAVDERVRSASALVETGEPDETQAALDQLFDEIRATPDPASPPRGLSELVDDELTVAQRELGKAPSPDVDAVEAADRPSISLIAEASAVVDAAPAIPEPPSVADALAAEMEEDDRIHGRRGAAVAPAGPAVAPAEPVETPTDDLNAEPVDPDVEAAAEPLAGVVIEESAEEPLEAEMAEAADARVPLVVRVLEWMNAPLAGLSDGVREALGKIAIVTTLNAVAVLLYVLIFRKGQG